VASERRDEAYAQLVRERKECTLCRELGLHNPAVPKLERFDSDEIGPWTRWLGDRNARLMIVGQDWGDVTYFQNNEGFDDCCTRTAGSFFGGRLKSFRLRSS
jgi:DNA polymerase